MERQLSESKLGTPQSCLLGTCCLEELDAKRCGCWERPLQSEVVTIPEVEAMAERSCAETWEPGIRIACPSASLWGTWEVDQASGPAVFGFVSLSAPVKELWIIWVKHVSWTQQLSPSLTALLSALPHRADFPEGRTPRSPFWMAFAPRIKAKMSSHFLKSQTTHTKITHRSPKCHSQGSAAKIGCKCHWAWFSSFLFQCDYDMCWYLLCKITTDIGHFRKYEETANHNICNIIKAGIMLVWV